MRYFRIKLLNYLVKHLLRAVIVDDVIAIQGQRVFLGGKELSPVELNNLAGEAIFLEDSRLWQVMGETLQNTAQKAMFEKSEKFEDVLSGKLMLYNLDVQKQIVQKLAELGRLNRKKV